MKDPVCGMSVDPGTAKHMAEYEGKTYYFCSAGCATKFKADPGKYLKPACSGLISIGGLSSSPPPGVQKSSEPANSAYVCPMCPDVRKPAPGPCPKCGMALERETPAISSRVEYTCPMHPEVVRPGPGSCPICGMALEPANRVG